MCQMDDWLFKKLQETNEYMKSVSGLLSTRATDVDHKMNSTKTHDML